MRLPLWNILYEFQKLKFSADAENICNPLNHDDPTGKDLKCSMACIDKDYSDRLWIMFWAMTLIAFCLLTYWLLYSTAYHFKSIFLIHSGPQVDTRTAWNALLIKISYFTYSHFIQNWCLLSKFDLRFLIWWLPIVLAT